MRFARILSLLILGASMSAHGKPVFNFTGQATHRFFQYANNPDHSQGQDHWLLAEQNGRWSSEYSFKAQLYAFAGNSKADQVQSIDALDSRSQISEAWPGDVYLQGTWGPALLKLGYQQITWQEGMGLSYTNFINARDQRASIFDPSDQVYRSAPAVNLIFSGENLSFQTVYLPYSQFNLNPPTSRSGSDLASALAPGQTIRLVNPPAYRTSHEYGTRLTWAGEGFDFSLFYFFLRDRKLVYELSPLSSATELRLQGRQDFMSTQGLTSTWSVHDFLLRLEYLQVPQRSWNVVGPSGLSVQPVDESAWTVGIDSPTWENFSFMLQYSSSQLNQEPTGLERKKQESMTFVHLQYSSKSDKILRLSALQRQADNSLYARASYSWPLLKKAELELADEVASGPETSQAAAMKDLNKFYLQITHRF